jgi:phosphoenolpyruvate phosphomutase / 2-hydroxyethylphosphonate cytidylyltransferase
MKKNLTKKVFVSMSADVIHHGHINIIKEARKYGDVTVGLLADDVITKYKRLPYLTWINRKKIIENIKGVKRVFKQNEWEYVPSINSIKPDFLVHGSDWKNGPLKKLRSPAIKALKKFGGKLIEVEYTKGISAMNYSLNQKLIGTTPEIRKASLKKLIQYKDLVRIVETHNPLSALIVESLIIQDRNYIREFDGFWSSSLTDSTSQGKPDTESLDLSVRLNNINNIFNITTKPLIIDCDTGGLTEHFQLNVKTMERLGISAVIIEDKKGLKKNSLLGTEVKQEQDSINSFSNKISAGVKVRSDDNFMIIARVESLILSKGMKDALKRASAYIEAGADGIMIHSKKTDPKEIFEFSKLFRKNFADIPLVCVPSTYNSVKEKELIKNKFNVVIYANQILRAAYPAMYNAGMSILKNQRSFEIDKKLAKIKDILKLIPGTI